MENENKDKNIILTDEELKEVAGGAGPTLSAPSEALDKACRKFNKKVCPEKPFCMWKDGKCIWKPKS